MAKLDSNAAWRDATALVSANREVLFILAGVFFLLPSLLLSIVLGEPQVPPGATRQQVTAAMIDFYGRGWWVILLAMVVEFVGFLTILTLMRDRSRPTVAEAIRAGLVGFPTYFAAQMLFFLAFGLTGGLLVGLVGLMLPALAAVLSLLLLAFILFAGIRVILTAPVVAVEGLRNPVAALFRSWRITRGNFWRIFAFLALVAVLFVVAFAVIMIVVGIVLAVIAQGEVQRLLGDVVSSLLSAVAVTYFLGIIAAIYRQLGTGERRIDFVP